MTKIHTALFPGSFDPFTVGHESVLRRASVLFNKVIVGVGYNLSKKGFFSIEKRIEMIKTVAATMPNVEVASYSGLTIQYCIEHDIKFIIRGLRTAADFEFERAVAQMNKKLQADVETIFLLTEPDHTPISSSIVREILNYRGDVSNFIPSKIDINKYL